MKRAVCSLQLALTLSSVAILIVAYRWNERRYHQGDIVVVLGDGHGLHQMDVRLIILALIPWIGIVVLRKAASR